MTPDRIGTRRVVASVSGGKDSAAMSLHLRELGIEHDRVFCDTGWEHPATYEYLRGELTRVIGPIVEVRSPRTLPEWAVHKGIFPSRRTRWCTDLLKLQPMRAHLASLDEPAVVVTGVRAAESAKRAAMQEWEYADFYDCDQWRPILAWTLDDVIKIHRRHDLRPNPLYLRGAERVGCWPCIHAGRGELRLLARIDPARIDEIRALEAAVTESSRVIVGARGEALFHPRTLLRERRPGRAAGIDAQIAWAGTDEPDLFARPGDDGCMRWGMCETTETHP